MPSNPLTQEEVNSYAINRILNPEGYTGLSPYMPAGYFLSTPPGVTGPALWRLFDASFISTGIIDPNRLGTGATGAGNLYLADDGTWKLISGAPGIGDMLKATYDVDNDGVVDSAERIEIIVRNSTGTTLTKGSVVYLSGATGNRPNAVLSKADTEATSSKTIGIVVSNIANNSDGYVAVSGTLHNLDTSAFADGAAVWLSAATAGAYTSTIPVEPNHTVFIGYVARSHPTQGRLVILIQNGYELNELHGVLISAEANNDLLVYESSSTLWKNKSISTIFGGTPLVSVPTLAQVTTAGNTTTNAITVGGLIVDTNTLVVDSVNNRVGFGTTAPAYRADVQGTTLNSSTISAQGAFNINPLAAPSAIGGFTLSAGTNLGVGIYYYFVVYVTALGETSASNTLLVTTTTGNTTVNLTGIPVSSDARVTARKLYRTKLGGTSDNEWFLVTISDNVTTTYTDSIADTSLTGANLQGYKVNTTARYFTVSGTQGMIIDNNLTALGRNAGNAIITSNATAVRTVLVGAQAGQNITTGTSNVIVGVAGANVTTGSDNSLFGDIAGFVINSGYGNTIIGAQAGRFLNSGYQNIFIGQGAGSYLANGSTQVTTAFQNIAIGRNARLSTINDSNSIIIGDTALGLGTNTTVIGNSSTVTAAVYGNLLLGTTTTTGQKLQVAGNVFIKGSDSLSATKVFEVQNGAGASIMDFRNATYAFFGCGQGGGSNSGFIFNYSNTSYTQFAGYNYGAGSGAYKPILMDTDIAGRGQGIFVNFGTSTLLPPNSDTEFAVLGRTSDATTYISRYRNSSNTDKFAVRADGALFTNTLQGYSGTLSIPTNPPGSNTITITNGLITSIA